MFNSNGLCGVGNQAFVDKINCSSNVLLIISVKFSFVETDQQNHSIDCIFKLTSINTCGQ